MELQSIITMWVKATTVRAQQYTSIQAQAHTVHERRKGLRRGRRVWSRELKIHPPRVI